MAMQTEENCTQLPPNPHTPIEAALSPEYLVRTRLGSVSRFGKCGGRVQQSVSLFLYRTQCWPVVSILGLLLGFPPPDRVFEPVSRRIGADSLVTGRQFGFSDLNRLLVRLPILSLSYDSFASHTNEDIL